MGIVSMTDQERIRKIEQVLDEVRPNIQMDGGDVQFVKFEDGAVYLKLYGASVGCPASLSTVTSDIEQSLKASMNDVHEVITVKE